ncbi:hypothetical protein [Nonomuraea turcica]|uniref:hypothetical protein n=1 Tax=Nonomuraea sp. G32 TaxID=3067274 RepID=UPI00273B6E13|nr:hypothetical protein [Nonomuraea sp. G32]MDP4508522.1 hypothetical protein [Nonomuraea sp. G32]
MTPKQDLADAAVTSATTDGDMPDSATSATMEGAADTADAEVSSSVADADIPDGVASTDTEAATSATTDDATEQAPGGTSDVEQPTTTDAQPAAVGTPSDDEDGRGRRAGRVTRARIVGALAAMLVAAVAATAVLQWVAAAQADDARTKLEAERALRLEVSGAASAFSKALLSYDYRDLQTTRATLTAQATGDFLTTYDTAFGGAMAQVIVKLKAVSQATVREVYLADVDEVTAHAIVVVDQQVNTSEAIRSVKDSHLKIALVKDKGTWKVHDVTVLGAASEDQYTLDGGDQKKKD